MIELKKLNVHRIVDSEEAAARLEADGFTVINKNAEPDFVSMKVAELRAYADGKGISLGGAAKKDDIIKAIKARPTSPKPMK
jgi:hypothetical protein